MPDYQELRRRCMFAPKGSAGARDGKTILHVDVGADLKARLRRAAKASRMTLSRYVRELLVEHLGASSAAPAYKKSRAKRKDAA